LEVLQHLPKHAAVSAGEGVWGSLNFSLVTRNLIIYNTYIAGREGGGRERPAVEKELYRSMLPLAAARQQVLIFTATGGV
jgi:hypothetical protein